MSTFFQDHKQKRAQWQPRRRNGAVPTGTVVVHTYEAPAGRTARQGADYFLVRDNPASYHFLADALGGTLHLAPWSGEAWHDTASNNWSVGISMMTRAADWPNLTAKQRDNLVNGAAMGAHLYSRWLVSQGKAPIPARRINRAQAMQRMAGFLGHGEMDPGRRSDPGEQFPWAQFLTEFQRLEAGNTTPPVITPEPSEEDTMSPEQEKALYARLEQIVGWMDANFKAQNAAAEANRNALAGWTRDRTRDAVTASTAAILAEMPNVDLSQDRIDELVGGAVDKALDGKTIPVTGRIEIDVPNVALGKND